MVKRISALLLALLLLLPSLAFAAEQRVFDNGKLFTDAEIAEMEKSIEDIRSRYKVDVVILTTRDVPLTSSNGPIQDYADRYYERGGFGLGEDKAGVLYMIDIGNRAPCISTAGVMIDYLSDKRLDEILNSSYDALRRGQYGTAAKQVIAKVETFMQKGREEGNFRYDPQTGERLSGVYNMLTRTELFVALAVGALAACITGIVITSRYSMKGAAPANQAVEQGTVTFQRDEETFLRERVQRIRHASPPSGGGPRMGGGGRPGGGRGSAVHHSSSGGTHGGRVGGRF